MKRWMLAFTWLLIVVMMCSSAMAYETLQKGSKGDDVVLLQQALIEKGYLSGTADGSFGNLTAVAVASFQEAEGLEATGVADEATLQLLLGEEAAEAEADAEDSVFSGTWYFSSYEYLKYVSTPDRQDLHAVLEIGADSLKLTYTRGGEEQTAETSYFFNDGGIAFSIENDSSYLFKEDENGNMYLMGAGDGKIFPGFKYIFSRTEPGPDPAIGSNPDYWWEGDWVIYNVYDRDAMVNTEAAGSVSFGAYLETDRNFAAVTYPDGTQAQYSYDLLPNLTLLDEQHTISVTLRDDGSFVFSFEGCDYSCARTAPAKPEEEVQYIDRNVLIYNVDTGDFIAYGDPVTVPLYDTPETLPADMIPMELVYNGVTYVYDDSCSAPFVPEEHHYEVFMKAQAEEEPEPTPEPVDYYVPVNPWIYTGDNAEGILVHLLARQGWGPDYTFNAEDNSFTTTDDSGAEMTGAFVFNEDGSYYANFLVKGMERTLYAEDFEDYADDWDDLTLDPDHEYLEDVIFSTIKKEEKSHWWIELNDDGVSGTAEVDDDTLIPFTYEFAVSEEGEEYVKITYNDKTIDNISLRK